MFHRNCSSLSTDWTQGSCLVSDVKTRRLTIYNPTITPLLKCFCSWFDIILFVNILFLSIRLRIKTLVNIQDRRRFSGKIIFILFEIRKSAYLVFKPILLFYTSLSWIWGWYLVLAVKWDQVAIECKYVHCTSSGQAQESCTELQRPDPSLRIICQSEQFLQM